MLPFLLLLLLLLSPLCMTPVLPLAWQQILQSFSLAFEWIVVTCLQPFTTGIHKVELCLISLQSRLPSPCF